MNANKKAKAIKFIWESEFLFTLVVDHCKCPECISFVYRKIPQSVIGTLLRTLWCVIYCPANPKNSNEYTKLFPGCSPCINILMYCSSSTLERSEDAFMLSESLYSGQFVPVRNMVKSLRESVQFSGKCVLGILPDIMTVFIFF